MEKVQIPAIPVQAFNSPWRFQEVEFPRFRENRHMKVVSLSDLLEEDGTPLFLPKFDLHLPEPTVQNNQYYNNNLHM